MAWRGRGGLACALLRDRNRLLWCVGGYALVAVLIGGGSAALLALPWQASHRMAVLPPCDALPAAIAPEQAWEGKEGEEATAWPRLSPLPSRTSSCPLACLQKWLRKLGLRGEEGAPFQRVGRAGSAQPHSWRRCTQGWVKGRWQEWKQNAFCITATQGNRSCQSNRTRCD
jgi:hypothetical protein